MAEWVSDDGRARVWCDHGTMRVSVPAPTEGARVLDLSERETSAGGKAWVGRLWQGDELEVVAAAFDGDDLELVHVVSRPTAAGGESDPRQSDWQYRCARVVADQGAG